ncbi:hypothetical protein [Stenotrophomonas sp. CFBP8980]|uniref:hypothetical protein n=1 Tax=Stenotrophomonas sp. CFBP8980 TaxID=3096523 RepID=UPI002A6A7850|nr:hypothetical protein [Stenotrophomonas sp. CFBP8980]MDY1034221.1 hypothetical protein [Stenotrophomonas sp. CFBP8980]
MAVPCIVVFSSCCTCRGVAAGAVRTGNYNFPDVRPALDHYLSRPALSLPPLDVLEADHLVYKVGPSEPPSAPQLLDGLLMAGRQLIASAQAALERP